MTAPLVSDDVDLRGLPRVPIDRVRLFNSVFNAQANDTEWRLGVTLWFKSWDQVPAGSLPDDDVELCRLAELGRDQRTWLAAKKMALHNWVKCDDGRLYHPVVAEYVTNAWVARQQQRNRTANARTARLLQKENAPVTDDGNAHNPSVTSIPFLPPDPLLTPGEGEGNPPPIVPPPQARGGGRGARNGQKSPRVVQIEAFAYAAAERNRHC